MRLPVPFLIILVFLASIPIITHQDVLITMDPVTRHLTVVEVPPGPAPTYWQLFYVFARLNGWEVFLFSAGALASWFTRNRYLEVSWDSIRAGSAEPSSSSSRRGASRGGTSRASS